MEFEVLYIQDPNSISEFEASTTWHTDSASNVSLALKLGVN